jgi:hypothetical protein
MIVPIMDTEILDQVLLPLADQFEAGSPNHWYSFKPGEVNEYERLRECMAELVAEGSVIRSDSGDFRFSQPGYSKYLPRIRAQRTLPSAGR